jgi:DNA-binding NarL/FixJ family response regulator
MEANSLIRIAIAEDQNIVRRGFCELINSFAKFEIVAEASNGKELIERLSALQELPEIVLLDVSMPEMDGYDTLVAVKKKWPQIKVLILTMFNNEYTIIRMIRNKANGYLLKNSDPEELEKALLSIHRSNFYHSELVSTHFFHIMHGSAILPDITEKEKQFLTYIHTDLTYKEIAHKMHTTERSIIAYKDSLLEKFDVKSRPALVFWAIKLGYVAVE